MEHKSVALKHVVECIEECGWAIIGSVTDFGIPFSYTIGFKQLFNHPEVIVVGMPMIQTGELLHNVHSLLEEGKRFRDGDETTGIIVSSETNWMLPVRFNDVTLSYQVQYMPQAIYHYGEFEALQMQWPDKNGKFPSDIGYDNHNTQWVLSDVPS